MSLLIRFFLGFAFVLALLTAGCSSGGTTQNETAESVTPSDSSSSQSEQALHPKRTRNQRTTPAGKQQGFVTEEDTIEAQVMTRNHASGHAKAPPKRSAKKKYYSVQVGAFRVLANADKSQKLVKTRFKKPVYHFYDKAIKMYRVTVGNYSKLKDALGFLKTLQKKYPKEYKDSWVAEMRR